MACTLEIDEIRTFIPGGTITGRLICMLNTTESIEGIKVSLKGTEETHFVWPDSDNLPHDGKSTFYHEEIQISDACSLGAGMHKYPFAFRLPHSDIPSSFKHENGQVYYQIDCEVSRGTGRYFRNSEVVQVNVFIDFNDVENEAIMTPNTYTLDEEVPANFLLGNGHVYMDMTLEKNAFLVGEAINLKLSVKNKGRADIKKITIILESLIEFTSNNPATKQFITRNIIEEKKYLGPEREKNYEMEVKVPENLEIPCFKRCSLIRQWYALTAVASITSWHKRVVLSVPIKITHIGVPPQSKPINGYKIDSYTDRSASGSYTARPSAPPKNQESQSLLPHNNGNEGIPVLPPTYDEAVNEKS